MNATALLVLCLASTAARPYLSLWWPFQARTGQVGPPYYELLPVSVADADTIVQAGATVLVAGRGYTHDTQKTQQLLDWAASRGQAIDLDDEGLTFFIGLGVQPAGLSVEAYVDGLIAKYAAHPALHGWYVSNEPEWLAGRTGAVREGVYARYTRVVARFREKDPGHPAYASTATLDKLRFCREARPGLLLNSGFSFLHDGTISAASPGFQASLDTHLYNFEVDQLCTENWNVPWVYSLASNYWAGDGISPEEVRQMAWLMLAHGGRGIEWFVYSTVGGLVWDNRVPSRVGHFTHWLPAAAGGVTSFDVATAAITTDLQVRHGGAASARVDVSGPTGGFFNLRVYPSENAKPPWPPRFPALAPGAQYTLTAWIKTSGDATVNLRASTAHFTASSPQASGGAWSQLALDFVVPSTNTADRWDLGVQVSGTSGSAWVDDFALTRAGQSGSLLERYNPGFEIEAGPDRTPHEPLYSAMRRVNRDFEALIGELSAARRLAAFDAAHLPTAGLIEALTTDGAGVEAGVFVTPQDGYRLVLVNRDAVTPANVTLRLRTTVDLVLEDALDGTRQVVRKDQPATVALAAGDGRLLRVLGWSHRSLRETPRYLERFDGATAAGWVNDGGDWQVQGGVLEVRATAAEVRGLLSGQTFADFSYRGRFKLMPDSDPGKVLAFTFRKDPATSFNTNKYDARVKPDPGGADTDGFVDLTRRDLGSMTYLALQRDESFLPAGFVDFEVRAVGNTIEVFVDHARYLTFIDTNPTARFTSGQIGLRLEPGVHVQLDDLEVVELQADDAPCVEGWECSAWGACSPAGEQLRTCEDAAACGTLTEAPVRSVPCEPTVPVFAPVASAERPADEPASVEPPDPVRCGCAGSPVGNFAALVGLAVTLQWLRREERRRGRADHTPREGGHH